MITASGVDYAYPSGSHALRDIDATFESGKLTALIGPNGSGKSTLAKLVAGLIPPTRGRIEIDGNSPQESPTATRGLVSLAWQNPDNQLVCDIVEDDIAFGPENLGLSVDEITARIDEVVDRLELEDVRTVSIHGLSSAQKQVVAVAGAMAMAPKYLVLDEVTARLDPAAARRLLESVKLWSTDHGAGVIMITHHMSEVLKADWVVRLETDTVGGGRVVASGFASDVLGSTPINPDIIQLAPLDKTLRRLKRLGVSLPDTTNTVEELVEALCR